MSRKLLELETSNLVCCFVSGMPSGRKNYFPWKWAWHRSRDDYNFWHTIEHISKTTWARDSKFGTPLCIGIMQSMRTNLKVGVAYVTWPYNYWHTIEHIFKTIWASDFKFGKRLWLPGSAHYGLLWAVRSAILATAWLLVLLWEKRIHWTGTDRWTGCNISQWLKCGPLWRTA